MSDNNMLINALLDNAVSGNPRRYAAIIRAIESEDVNTLRGMLPSLKEQMENTSRISEAFSQIKNSIYGSGYAKRRNRIKDELFGALSSSNAISEDISIIDILSYQTSFMSSFIKTLYEGADLICSANIISFDDAKKSLEKDLSEDVEIIGKSRADAILAILANAESDALKNLSMEQQVNSSAISSFSTGLRRLIQALNMSEDYLTRMLSLFESYYNRLRHRHTEEGISVQFYSGEPSPVLTDISIVVWDNLDKAGEIEGGASSEEISVYTKNRARGMLESTVGLSPYFTGINHLLKDDILSFVELVTNLRGVVIRLEGILNNPVWKYQPYKFNNYYNLLMSALEDMSLSEIPTEGKTKQTLDKTERFALEHKNKCIREISSLIASRKNIDEISEAVLRLKTEERKFLLEENSFFVCRIGTGNMFLGVPPGEIEIFPGEKPNANLDNIWGSGFDDMRDYIKGLQLAKKWAPLFLATSPSFSNDKSNVLLVGPQGCGKTELLRAVGADKDSISIFATGSDFLTCWLGEAQKNPKRLFQEARKLQKISGRDVNILIDEIDQVLKKDDRGMSNKVNLSLEFQNLMDGVVNYPGIRVWGATNFPENIPTPMLRRFAKVEIVGEMSQEDRVNTLRYYISNFLPITDECFNCFEDWGRRLEGATGDIIRKVADEVWRSTIRSLIENNQNLAEEILNYLVGEYGASFEARDLSMDDRELIKEMMGDYKVGVLLINSSINNLLNNQAIKEQIAMACNTYAIAKQMKGKYT